MKAFASLRNRNKNFPPPAFHPPSAGAGQSLDAATRAPLETRFGHDFSRVRVHTDERAVESARALGAQAYTLGREIVFDRGQYAPHTPAGQRLLAHELAHVAQQDGSSASGPPAAGLRLGADDSPAEAEAAQAENGSGPLRVSRQAAAGQVQRKPQDYRRSVVPGPWSASKFITAGIGDTSNNCWSDVDPSGHYDTAAGADVPFSQACHAKICARNFLPLTFAFFVDTDVAPRPKPFADARLGINMRFISDRGREKTVLSETGTGTYAGPGNELRTSFGGLGVTGDLPATAKLPEIVLPYMVPFSPPGPGTLYVSLIHSDPTSGALATYADEIPIADCDAHWKSEFGHKTGVHVVIPDPLNAPQVYHRLCKQDGLDEAGMSAEIEKDEEGGLFYFVNGKKYPISEMPSC